MAKGTDMISVEVVENIGTISTNEKTGWSKQLRRIKWNGADVAKFDIRDWSPDDPDKMGRGITLTEAEAKELKKLLVKHFKK